MRHAAIFLDRDGTLVYPRHYPSRPEDLHLYAGIGPGLRHLRRAGFKLVVITNQSGIARGLFGVRELEHMHRHLRAALSRQDVRLDGIYYCPHHPDGVLPALAVRCECRKPQSGMLLQAADELDLDLERSWIVGDILDDIEAGKRAGCRGVLVDLGTERIPTTRWRQPDFVARDTRHALRIIAAEEHLAPAADRAYLPPAWMPALEAGSMRVQGERGGLW